ncbi:cyclin-like protein [Cristinia sonorae]|uniref:Cyclin-like protein n=1 Tax=Cristinia sonorae TaxID=1940300 RepID=A0A8K0UQI0_9AGAR|nr:cyclin-like protein [Cristinia sonorae]
MSSNVPVRRTTRVTRTTTTVVKNKENSTNARTTTRAKPTSSTQPPAPTDVKPTVVPRAAVSTIATRAKAAQAPVSRVDPAAQGKRKREALGEVPRPVPNLTKPGDGSGAGVGLKGKEKAKETFDGVVLKKTTTTTTVRSRLPTSTAPAATVTTTATSRKTRSTLPQTAEALEDVKEEEVLPGPDDNDMAIDHPMIPVPAPRRFTVARAVAAAPHAATSTRTSTTRRAPPRHVARDDDDDVEDSRVFKKRRTSSDAPDEDVQAVEDAVKVDEVEADPNGDQWVDLDADDADDPLMVSEYVVEIFHYLKEVELTTMPNPNYMEMQKDLAWKMRGILTDWLIQVHSRFRLLPETLFLCVNIIDRFLSQRVVSLAKLQLVGITCMFIAAKVEEIVAPGATNFLYCADSSYSEAEILQAERYILKTLDWNMSFPNPIHFLRRISKADDYNVHSRTIAKYLLEIQCLEWRLIAAPPSLIAAAAIWLARLILGNIDWTPNLAHYSSYPESALIPTANLMLNYILKPIRHQSFFKKYAGKRFLKVSNFVRDWALDRWQESEQVSLQEELPKLKILVKEAREHAEYAHEAGVNGYAEE